MAAYVCGDVGLGVFVSVVGWILIALRVELTELINQTLAPVEIPSRGKRWLPGTGLCRSFSVPHLDVVPRMSKVHSCHLPTEHTRSDPLHLPCSVRWPPICVVVHLKMVTGPN